VHCTAQARLLLCKPSPVLHFLHTTCSKANKPTVLGTRALSLPLAASTRGPVAQGWRRDASHCMPPAMPSQPVGACHQQLDSTTEKNMSTNPLRPHHWGLYPPPGSVTSVLLGAEELYYLEHIPSQRCQPRQQAPHAQEGPPNACRSNEQHSVVMSHMLTWHSRFLWCR
jgi:hypothetical protein